MARRPARESQRARMLALALGLPGAALTHPFGDHVDVCKVGVDPSGGRHAGGKMFALIGVEEPVRATVKVDPDDPNTVIWDPNKVGALWDALKNDTPYPPPSPKPAVIDGGAITAAPDTISVSVLNGTHATGKATKVGNQLSKQGYQVVSVANADSSGYASTVIRYDPAYEAEAARTLAAALPGASRVKVPGLGYSVQVVVGKQFGGVDEVSVQKPPDPNEHIRKANQSICS